MVKKGKMCLTPAKIKTLKESYYEEYKFIDSLFGKVNIPSQEDSSDSEDESHGKHLHTDESDDNKPKKTSRARTLEDLHKRIEEIREQKYTYRGKIRKKSLKNKLKKKKKIFEKKKDKNENKKAHSHEDNTQEKPAVKSVKTPFNTEGNLVFSKLDLLGETSTVNDCKISKKEGNIQHVMKKIEKRKNFIKRLEDRGDKEKVNVVMEETAWKNVLKKAEGLKVKDDPFMLKKALNKKVARKKASQKKWDMRLKTVEKQKNEKQRKRTENITKRKQDKTKSKMKKVTKKGRYISNV